MKVKIIDNKNSWKKIIKSDNGLFRFTTEWMTPEKAYGIKTNEKTKRYR